MVNSDDINFLQFYLVSRLLENQIDSSFLWASYRLSDFYSSCNVNDLAVYVKKQYDFSCHETN